MASMPCNGEHGVYQGVGSRDSVLKVDQPKSDVPNSSPDEALNLTILESLGPFGIWTYAVGYTLITTSVSFLLFLWSSDGSNWAWRQIALSGWMTRCVSLSSTLVRIAIAIQATTATSLVAALLLQQYRVPLIYAPAFSMIRWENSGPWTLAWLFWPNYGREKTFWAHSGIVILTVISILSQLSSTLLLTDIHSTLTILKQNLSSVPSNFDPDSLEVSNSVLFMPTQYWIARPNIFPSFAEYHEAVSDLVDGFYDTGPTFRAFFPLTNQTQRTALSSVSGILNVLDARTICMKPIIDFSVFSVGFTTVSINDPSFANVVGTVGVRNVDNPYYETYPQTTSFNCSVILGYPSTLGGPPSTSSEWQLSACSPDNGMILDKLINIEPTYDWYLPFLIFNSSGDVTGWYSASTQPVRWVEQSSAEWSILTANFNHSPSWVPPTLAVSLCFTAMSGGFCATSASDGHPHEEPTVSYNLSSGQYDTQSLRLQLGVTNPPGSLLERGVWQLGPPENFSSGRDWLNALSSCGSSILYNVFESTSVSGISAANRSTFFCVDCLTNYAFSSDTISNIHPVIATIFNDVTRFTRHPGLALQAIVTVVTGVTYYDLLSLFTIDAPASIAEYVTIIAPTQWVGLSVVISLAALHSVIVTSVLIVFAKSRKRAIIGSAWSAIGQVTQSEEVLHLTKESSLVDDETMAKRLKVTGEDKLLVGIDFIDGLNEVRLRKRK